ncbi:MAG: DUF134 domain-containing protein [Bacteroidetes bacterium]|nr:DUF134 domain-containing protein [Bacteroidota bacterium]
MKRKRGRPPHCRAIGPAPEVTCFKPAGIPLSGCRSIVMTLDELEAVRLADYEGLYQDEAAVRMEVSRATFGRILESARKKIARVLIEGLVLEITGGEVMSTPQHMGRGGFCLCPSCDIRIPHQAGMPCIKQQCPQCGKHMLREHGEHHTRLQNRRKD